MICKSCGKRITYKTNYKLAIITFFVLVILIRDIVLSDFAINIVSKTIILLISSLISLLITFLITILIGFKELD